MPVFRSIQHLRGVAALAVVAFHAAQRAGGGPAIGAAGVDVFFVISGFIMWSVTRRRAVSPGRFMLHRVIRIVPLYWLVTLAMAAFAGLFPRLQAPAAHVLLSLLFVPHADPAGAALPLLAPGWTLDYEMAFYLVYAAILPLPRRARLAALVAVLGGLVALGVVLRPAGVVARTYTDPIMLEFAAGAALAALARHPPWQWSAALLAAGVMAFAVQAALPVDPAWRLLAWGLPALSVVAGALGLEAAHVRPPAWPGRALSHLGDASYAIYLLHGLVVSACWRLLPAMPVAGFVAACLAGSAAVGLACFRGVERPMTVALRRATGAPVLASGPVGR